MIGTAVLCIAAVLGPGRERPAKERPGADDVIQEEVIGSGPLHGEEEKPPEESPWKEPEATTEAGATEGKSEAAPAATTPKSKPPPSPEAIARQREVDLDEPRGARKKRYTPPGSKQRFEFEFKIGPYLPDVDRKWGGSGPGPYFTIFGRTDDTGTAVKKPRLGVMPILGFEWQFIYLAGPLSIGTQIGFFRDTAKALLANPMPGENVRSQADNVIFGVVPIALLLGYRFEMAADRWKVPLVPYFRAGPAYAFWWMKDGSKNIAVDDRGRKGRGGVWGWQINPGLMLRMDFLEPNVAKKMDQTTGINHFYLFGEYQLSRLANFGVGNSIEVGDSTFFAGIAMEF